MDRAELDVLEDKAMWAWPPCELALIGGWQVRGSDGHTNRANSVLGLGFDGSITLGEAVDLVEAWYAVRELAPCFKLFDGFDDGGLERHLVGRGYGLITPSLVMMRDGFGGLDVPFEHVEIESKPSQAVINVMCHGMAAGVRAKRVALLNRIKRPRAFALLFDHGEPVGVGLAVHDGVYGSMSAIMVRPDRRGLGHGASVVARLMVWLEKMGSTRIFLQVEADNDVAIGLYRRFGFEPCYRYWYRKRVD